MSLTHSPGSSPWCPACHLPRHLSPPLLVPTYCFVATQTLCLQSLEDCISFYSTKKLFPWHSGFISKGWGSGGKRVKLGSELFFEAEEQGHKSATREWCKRPSRGSLGFGVQIRPRCSSCVTVKVIEHL